MTVILILFVILVVAIFLSGNYDAFQNYKEERIINIVPPPNVYLTDEMEYSPETVMANVNDVRQEVQRYQMELPNLVAVYVNDHMRQLDR
jgi:hypothetical protein